MENDPLQRDAELLANPVQVVQWLEAQAPGSQKSHAGALFDRLINEAAQPKSLSGQACVRLCGLVEQSSKSVSEELRTWAFSRGVTTELFNFFIDWNESDHHRSMKLVLDLIVQSFKRHPDKDDASTTKACLLDALISIVIGRSAKPVAKSAIKTLDHFLSKGVFTLREIHANYISHRQELAQSDDIEVWRMFMVDLLHWMRLHFVCPTSGRFIVCVYRGWRHADYTKPAAPGLETWYQWLLDFLTEEPSLLESIKNYIFLPLFKADRAEGLRFLGKMNGDNVVSTASNLDMDMPALLRLSALETGKRVGLVEEPGLGEDKGQAEEWSSIMVHEKILDNVLAHPSHEVRALALSLLVTSPSTTRPYSFAALGLLRKHLITVFADPDAKFRVEVSGKVRDMFRRVRGAIHVLKRSIPRARARAQKANVPGAQSQVKPDLATASQPILYRSNFIVLPEAQLTHCLEYHEEFLRWYIGFLCSELTPTASYQRHIASLKAVMFITRLEGETSKMWETEDDQRLFFDLFDDKWTRALFDLLMDPFDDVRDISASAVKRFYANGRYRRFTLTPSGADRCTAETLAETSRRAEELARRTSRADHSDGASRVSQLLYRFLGSGQQQVALLSRLISELERKTSVAESDLGRAVLEAPLHGNFASLNHVWQVASELQIPESDIEAVRELQSTLVSCGERVWKAVRDVLCDDSPEGHLPQELEELEGLDTKSLLSFSFRAVHESR
ncbi:Uncharacterized protein TCAP_05259 [Tolypocladium capitatum]|uniref:Uncharacterized protein n=1 Tax=Tolypocladium capitatum TaxID=45235 RepID=A0A2K3QB95_9HYPO|nr:Uncharacterized protein TCAP_05259 [Tolypocladium capitatum]